eukprot:4943980-Pyramimonas_sp.AAC.1
MYQQRRGSLHQGRGIHHQRRASHHRRGEVTIRGGEKSPPKEGSSPLGGGYSPPEEGNSQHATIVVGPQMVAALQEHFELPSAEEATAYFWEIVGKTGSEVVTQEHFREWFLDDPVLGALDVELTPVRLATHAHLCMCDMLHVACYCSVIVDDPWSSAASTWHSAQ